MTRELGQGFYEEPIHPSSQGIGVGTIAKGVVAAILVIVGIVVAYKAATTINNINLNPAAGILATFGAQAAGVPQLPNLGMGLQNTKCQVEQYFNSIKHSGLCNAYAGWPPGVNNSGFVTPSVPRVPYSYQQKTSFSPGYTQQPTIRCPTLGGLVNINCIDPLTGLSYQAESALGLCPIWQGGIFGAAGCCLIGPSGCGAPQGIFCCIFTPSPSPAPSQIICGSLGGGSYGCFLNFYCPSNVCPSAPISSGPVSLSGYSCTVFCSGASCFI